MPNTFTTKFRLCKPQSGILDWHPYYYDAMSIIDYHIPRIFMSAPRITSIATSSGGSLTANQYYFYKVTAMNGTLTTLATWEDNRALTDATNKTVDINWSAVTGVTKYRVYRADTSDGSYFPVDGDYNLLAEVTGSTMYSDDGTVVPSGAMPSTPTWYTTEIDQLYIIGDVTEGQTQHVTPATLVDNMDNVRYMLNQINGQTNWDDALVTNLYKLQNGKSGGQQITGGTGASESLTLRSTAHATKGTIISDSVLDMGTHKITNVVDPTNNQEAATKKYVDDFLSGGGIDYCDTSTASAGQTIFDTSAAYVLGGKNIHVYVDGVLMTFTDDYSETSTTRITMVHAMTGGEKVSLVWKAGSAVGNADTVDGINASATPTANMLLALDANTKLNGTVLVGVHANILDNGGFEIWQKGTSFVAPANNSMTADRWKFAKVSGSTSVVNVYQNVGNALTGDYCSRINVTTGGAVGERVYLYQTIEKASNYRNIVLSATISVKTTIASKICIQLYDNNGTSESSYHTGSGNYETLTVSRTIYSAATVIYFRIGFVNQDVVTGDVYMDNAMFVIGDKSVNFIPSIPSDDWNRCMRYYMATTNGSESAVRIVYIGDCTAGTSYGPTMAFPTVMAATPTYTLIDVTRSGFNAPAGAGVHKAGIEISQVCNTTGVGRYFYTGYIVEVT